MSNHLLMMLEKSLTVAGDSVLLHEVGAVTSGEEGAGIIVSAAADLAKNS